MIRRLSAARPAVVGVRADLDPRVGFGLQHLGDRVERHVRRRLEPRRPRREGHARDDARHQSAVGTVAFGRRTAGRGCPAAVLGGGGAAFGRSRRAGCPAAGRPRRPVPRPAAAVPRSGRRGRAPGPGRSRSAFTVAPVGVRGQRSRPSSTPSPSSSPGQPSASTVAPRGVSEQRSRPSGIWSPSLSLGQPRGSTSTPAGVSGHRSRPSGMLSPSESWEQPRCVHRGAGHGGRAAVHAVGHAVAVAVARAAARRPPGARRACRCSGRGCRARRRRRLSRIGLLPSMKLTPDADAEVGEDLTRSPSADRSCCGCRGASARIITVGVSADPEPGPGQKAPLLPQIGRAGTAGAGQSLAVLGRAAARLEVERAAGRRSGML